MQKQYQTQLDEYSGFFVYAYTAMIYAMAMETSKLFDKNVQAISVQKLQNQFYSFIRDHGKTNPIILTERKYTHSFSEDEISFYRQKGTSISEQIREQQKNIIVISENNKTRIKLSLLESITVMRDKRKTLEPLINNLLKNRNALLAHTDEKEYFSSQCMEEQFLVKIVDLYPLISYSLEISNFIITYFTGITKIEKLSNTDDITRMLKFIKTGVLNEYFANEYIRKGN